MVGRKVTSVQQYSYGYEKRNASGVTSVPPLTSPPPEPSGGFTAFPASAPQIFPLQQSLVTLAFNATKLQPQNSRVWKRLQRIFAMLARERKETKEALQKFLRLDEIGKKIVFRPKVQRLRENLVEKKKKRRKFTEKPPPDLSCVAWLLGVVPALRRAPNRAARLAWRVAG